MKRKIALILATLLMSLGLTATGVVTATVANAAGECGSGYGYLRGYAVYDSRGNRTSTLEIYYNSANGYNCAINRAAGITVGGTIYRGVWIKRYGQSTPDCNGGDIRCDVGRFTYYAGPVYVYARGSCITAYAWNDATSKFGSTLGNYLLAKAHCG